MSASMVFAKGVLVARGIWVCCCSGVAVFVPQVLEAVGRKDLRTAAAVLGRGAGADSGLGNATSDFRPSAVRSLPRLREVRHRLVPAAAPSDFRPNGPCDPRRPDVL